MLGVIPLDAGVRAILVFMCRLFGTIPNDEKLEKVIRFAMKKPVITTKEPIKDFDA